MPLKGFEKWNTYELKYDNNQLSTYFPSQGDIIGFNNTPDGQFLVCISNCCDLEMFDDKCDHLIFVTAYQMSEFLKKRYIDHQLEMQKEQQKSKKSDFPTTSIEKIATKKAIEEYYHIETNKHKFEDIFKNHVNRPRYVFLPHNTYFDKDIIIDLQSIGSISLDKSKSYKSINECIGQEEFKVKNIYAKMDHLFRDDLLQRLGTYISRISRPDYNLGDKKDKTGFWEQIFSRAMDDLK